MQINILSLQVPMLQDFCSYGILHRALTKDLLNIDLWDIRDFGIGKRKVVDDKPFGGGAGMLLRPEPIVNCLEAIELSKRGQVFLFNPGGRVFDQNLAIELSQLDSLTLICGRYEGVDQRVLSFVDGQISLGNFVMMGGEVAAMAVLETVARLLPGVLGNEKSLVSESCTEFIEYPQYTKPIEFRGLKVPLVLRSGNHQAIFDWKEKHKTKLVDNDKR